MGFTKRGWYILVVCVGILLLVLAFTTKESDAKETDTDSAQKTIIIGYDESVPGYSLGMRYYFRTPIESDQQEKVRELLSESPGITSARVHKYNIFVDRGRMFSQKEIDEVVTTLILDISGAEEYELLDLSDCNPESTMSADCEKRIERFISQHQR